MSVVMAGPLVSVVIPTRNRPDMVVRAVRSVLRQTFASFEIIVVIDGPDPLTEQRLTAIDDERLNTILLTKSAGGSEARNTGARNARGEWVAFLDDDDEWFPEKLEKQIAAARRQRTRYPVIACRLIARTPRRDYVWPTRLPGPSEPLCEYLFVRKSFFFGEGLLLTSTLLMSRELMQKIPFRAGLKKHQDSDWVLRAVREEGASLEVIDEPLSIWHIEENRATISGERMWSHSLEWLRNNRGLIRHSSLPRWRRRRLSNPSGRLSGRC
jgi:glycosyltransferase involved in cell wall biosynthesis